MFTLQTSSAVTIPKIAIVTRIGDSQWSLDSRVENIFFVSIRKEDDTKVRTYAAHSDREWAYGLDIESKSLFLFAAVRRNSRIVKGEKSHLFWHRTLRLGCGSNETTRGSMQVYLAS